MKIVWVMDKELDVASDRAYIATLSGFLGAIGVQAQILARYREEPKIYPDADIEYIHTPPIRIIKRTVYFLRVAIHLLLLCNSRRFTVDAVVVDRPTLVFAALPAILIRNLRRRARPAFVLDVRSLPNDPKHGVKGNLSWFAFQNGLKLASWIFDGCMAITPAMARYISSNSRFEQNSIGLWSSAFDADLFDAEVAVADETIARRRRVTLVYHGAIAPNRMLLETIEALAICSADVEFVLIGNGELRSALRDRVAKLGLLDRVTFLDPVEYERVPGFLKAADIGIVPIPDTLWFDVSMPIKLLEYMAMELPVIAPLTTPVKTVIGQSGCDIEPFEVAPHETQSSAIAIAIDKAVARWGKGFASRVNRARVLGEFSWDAQAGRIQDYLSRFTEPSA